MQDDLPERLTRLLDHLVDEAISAKGLKLPLHVWLYATNGELIDAGGKRFFVANEPEIMSARYAGASGDMTREIMYCAMCLRYPVAALVEDASGRFVHTPIADPGSTE
jgi:hypothetical protein